MLSFEYMTLPMPVGDVGYVKSALDKLGLDKWELVAVSDKILYFKRPTDAQLRRNVGAEGQNIEPQVAPVTKLGFKEVATISSRDAGIKSSEHQHMLKCVVGKEAKVESFEVQQVDGHTHEIKMLGVLDEADGHTHTFEVW